MYELFIDHLGVLCVWLLIELDLVCVCTFLSHSFTIGFHCVLSISKEYECKVGDKVYVRFTSMAFGDLVCYGTIIKATDNYYVVNIGSKEITSSKDNVTKV